MTLKGIPNRLKDYTSLRVDNKYIHSFATQKTEKKTIEYLISFDVEKSWRSTRTVEWYANIEVFIKSQIIFQHPLRLRLCSRE